jgi:hypothetical protein|tara:strand:+ start:89 stop:502 length:414 start_codon:yes stop_codon:yes gene_type:complete
MSKKKVPQPGRFAMGEIRKRLKGSEIIYDNRDALAQELLRLGSSKITDVVDIKNGSVTLKALEDIPDHALTAIKKIKVTPTRGGDQIEVEMIDKVRVLQMLAKSAGLLDTEKVGDKPSIVNIEMVMPDDGKDDTSGS